MRVGLFAESYPPIINGVSTSVRTLIAELERAGHEVFVFTSYAPDYTDDRPGVYRYPSVNSLVEPDYTLPIPLSPAIARAIPTLGLDIIHSQSPFLLGGVARRAARALGVPLVSTNHTLYTEYAHYFPLLPRPVTRRAIIGVMRRYYNACDHVLAPSDLTRRRLISYGVRRPIQVIPTGIPEPPYLLTSAGDTRREWGVPAEGRILLYVGRLAPEKNLEMLIRAFAQIVAVRNDAWLVVAGSGKSAGRIQSYARQMGVEGRTVFTGFLGRTKLDPLYAAAEAFLFPSKTETQGLAIGEALAAGTPAVVVNEGGAPEAVRDGETGFLVEDDPSQMAARALEILADRSLRRRLSDAARSHAKTLAPDRIAGRVIAVYEALLADRPKRADQEDRQTLT